MDGSFARRAGDALIWKAIQLASTKGIFFVRTLILARLLAPADFGLFAIAVSAVGFFMTTTELGMVPALVQRPEAEETHYDGAWTVGMVRALGVSAVLVVAAPVIAHLFAEPRAGDDSQGVGREAFDRCDCEHQSRRTAPRAQISPSRAGEPVCCRR